MKNRSISITALTSLILTTAAVAEGPPVPRQPVGPREVLEMLPPAANSMLPVDKISVRNIGNRQLHIAYLDAAAGWQQQDIDAGQQVVLYCPNCAGSFKVAFHNGKEQKEVSVTGGEAYLLGWSEQIKAWVLTSSSR
jgi:hypothetical protein